MSLIVGGEGRLTARAFDAEDRTIYASITWSSADPAIATVGGLSGNVITIAAGTTTVTATAGALSATASVSVRPSAPVSVDIYPSALTLIAGEVEGLTAYAVDSRNRPTSALFEWSSADPAVATVGKTDGIVTAISLGATTVTVAAGALRATARVSVTATASTVAGSFAFMRMTSWSPGGITSDVLTFSGADRTPRSLPRPGHFASIGAPAWSPDGTQLAVEVIHDFFEDHGIPYYNSDVYVLDASAPVGPAWRALTANRASTSPSWSPDGKRIAYAAEGHISIVDAAGGAPVRLVPADAYYDVGTSPRWSPDGTRLAFASWVEGNNVEIFIVNVNGTGLTNVTRNPALDRTPSWSPDGTRLVFASTRAASPGNWGDVYVVDVDGTNVTRLTSIGAGTPSWSPDGRQIIFESGGKIHVMNADGSSVGRLTTPPQDSWDSAPVWRR